MGRWSDERASQGWLRSADAKPDCASARTDAYECVESASCIRITLWMAGVRDAKPKAADARRCAWRSSSLDRRLIRGWKRCRPPPRSAHERFAEPYIDLSSCAARGPRSLTMELATRATSVRLRVASAGARALPSAATARARRCL